MIARGLLASLAALTLLLMAYVSAFAADPIDGQAPEIADESPAGYYLWRDGDGIHIRTHGPEKEHLFVARLYTDGEFAEISTVRLEGADGYVLRSGAHGLVLRFHTFDAVDGIDFRIEDGNWLMLNLRVNGVAVPTEEIFLGGLDSHPETNPFIVTP